MPAAAPRARRDSAGGAGERVARFGSSDSLVVAYLQTPEQLFQKGYEHNSARSVGNHGLYFSR